MPDGHVIEFDRVTKRFGDVAAVSDFSGRVEPGVVTGFLGPNGAGKTTTLRMLLGQINPTSGSATIGGALYDDLKHPARVIAAMPENPVFRPRRSVERHLTVVAKSHGIPLSRVDEIIRFVGLGSEAEARIATLSLGMRQRLSAATALLGDPSALVLDEPANGLDPEGIRWMRMLIRGLADEGRTVLVSSHVLSEVEQVADDILIIARGQRKFAGSLATLADPTSGPVVVDAADRDALTAALVEAGYEFEILRSGLTVRGSDAARIGVVAATAGVALTTLQQRGPSLEDVFVDLVNDRPVRFRKPEPEGADAAAAGADAAEAEAEADAEVAETDTAVAEPAIAEADAAEAAPEVAADDAGAEVAEGDAAASLAGAVVAPAEGPAEETHPSTSSEGSAEEPAELGDAAVAQDAEPAEAPVGDTEPAETAEADEGSEAVEGSDADDAPEAFNVQHAEPAGSPVGDTEPAEAPEAADDQGVEHIEAPEGVEPADVATEIAEPADSASGTDEDAESIADSNGTGNAEDRSLPGLTGLAAAAAGVLTPQEPTSDDVATAPGADAPAEDADAQAAPAESTETAESSDTAESGDTAEDDTHRHDEHTGDTDAAVDTDSVISTDAAVDADAAVDTDSVVDTGSVISTVPSWIETAPTTAETVPETPEPEASLSEASEPEASEPEASEPEASGAAQPSWSPVPSWMPQSSPESDSVDGGQPADGPQADAESAQTAEPADDATDDEPGEPDADTTQTFLASLFNGSDEGDDEQSETDDDASQH